MNLDETAELMGISALELVRRTDSLYDMLETTKVRRMRHNSPVTRLFQWPSRVAREKNQCDAGETHRGKQKT